MTRSIPRRFVLITALLLTAAVDRVDASPQAAPTPAASAVTDDSPPPPPRLTAGDAVEVPIGDQRVRLRLETSAPETGLPIVFTVEFLDADGRVLDPARVALPEPGEMIEDFDVVASEPPAASATPPSRDLAPRRWSLRTFGSGPVELPSIRIDLDGRIARTEPRTIEVASVAGLDTDPSLHRDIANAVEVTPPGAGALPWIVAGVGAVALALVAIWWWRRPTPAPPPEPADRWALGRLDALLAEGLVDAGRVQAFYFALTDIVRAFIERRYDLAAPDRTTAEFIDEARRHPELGENAATLLGNLLKAADMVKFAGDRPQTRDCDRAVETIRRFVIDAGPRPVIDDAEHGGATAAGPDHRRRHAITDAVSGIDRLERRS